MLILDTGTSRKRSPRHLARAALMAGLLATLPGCVSTVAHIATAPVRIADKAVDWTTTSQSESDRNRGRALRHNEARLGKLDRAYRDSRKACDRGDRAACDRARAQYAEIQSLTSGMPAEPR